MRKKILTRSFFQKRATYVAPMLLGKYLVRRAGGIETAYMITETESYDGPNDLASHASKGKTARNEVMFGTAGRLYIYLCYGMHYMLNIVTGRAGYPAAVLIRGVISGNVSHNVSNARTHPPSKLRTSDVRSLNGPGKLTKALTIDKTMHARYASPESGLWFEDRGIVIRKTQIQKTPRIGVSYAGHWADKPYRFVLTL